MNQLNPFQAESKEVSVMQNSDAERSIQEVQASMVIAKKFPRDLRNAMDNILNSCTRPTLANAALYSYPRGGTQVTGPSIRLAEAIAQHWENMQYGIRELSNANGESVVEAFAWDMQSNTKQVKVFTVKHERKARGQIQKLTDSRDIYELVANMGARRMRACILGVIPGDVVEAAVQQCADTQANNIDVSQESIKKMIDAFKDTFGITQEHIEKKIGRRATAINAPQVIQLRQIFQSLKDGMAKPSDYFEIVDVIENVATEKAKIGKLEKPKKKSEGMPENIDQIAAETVEKQRKEAAKDYATAKAK